MMLDQALEIVTERYGWRSTYVTTAGQVVYVVGAEKELGPIPGVLPRSGIGLLAPEVTELARDTITVEALVRRKNPELLGE